MVGMNVTRAAVSWLRLREVPKVNMARAVALLLRLYGSVKDQGGPRHGVVASSIR
jgi:hypothetical protein